MPNAKAMSRRRISAGPELSRRQEEALGSPLRVVRELGPAAFVLREEGPQAEAHREYGTCSTSLQKVFLGNPHSCSCAIFAKEKDLCKHICWLLLKKFKLPRDHEYALQLGLVEREINDVLQGLQITFQPRVTASSAKELQIADDGYIKQKEIDNEDICPICQDTLLKKMLPVTYCRFGCGNNIHIVCMKIWIDHQKELEKDSLVKCPLCREDFAPRKLILEEFRNCKRLVTAAEKQHLDKHLGIPCNNCRVCPIEGNCYKCTECREYHLCQACFRSFCHPSHNFAFREKRDQTWRSVEPAVKLTTSGENMHSFDFKNSKVEDEKVSCIPQQVINSLPTMLVRKCSSLLDPGLQCRLCLKSFCIGQVTRSLLCEHKFHRNCIDHRLHKENACPIDGQVVYNPLTLETVSRKDKTNLLPQNSPKKQSEEQLFIPGTGLLAKQMKPGQTAEKTQTIPQEYCIKKNIPLHCEQNLTLNGISYTSTRDAGPTTQKTKSLKFSRYMKGLVLVPKPDADVLTQKSVDTGLRGISVYGSAS